MQAYQTRFIELCLAQGALKFGSFTLKSGRQSPYFFNAGLFNSGKALAELGHYYAACIQAATLSYDMLFGPAYKGIPIVATTAITLAAEYKKDVPYAFNRKEAKDHGEGGQLVGAALQGRVLMVDDVITAGTALRESQQIIRKSQAELVGVVIALDRQERGQGELSAIAEIRAQYQVPVMSIITFSDLLEYVDAAGLDANIRAEMLAYREEYGV